MSADGITALNPIHPHQTPPAVPNPRQIASEPTHSFLPHQAHARVVRYEVGDCDLPVCVGGSGG